ncbi:MAG: uncharacterized protein QOI08_1230 [Actinomycetota bacterium]|nr:uncharacterized protein [Actinomycetota bacterium]
MTSAERFPFPIPFGWFCVGYPDEFTELPDVPFRDHVWPKFLRENAQRAFNLPAVS